MSFMQFAMLMPISSFVAAAPFIKEEWGLTNTQAGAVFSSYLAAYAVAALFIIPLSDRLGPKRILIGAVVLSVATQVLFPIVAGNFVVAIILRALTGIGFLGVYMPGLRIISERFKGSGRGSAVGLYVTFQYAANSLSLAITGILMASMAWRDAYLYIAVLSAISLPLAIVLMSRSNVSHNGSGARGLLNVGVLKVASIRYLIAGYSIHALNLYTVRAWLPVFLTGVQIAGGASLTEAAVTGATVGGFALTVGSIGPLMGGAISDRFGRAVSAMTIFSLSVVCFLAIGWLGSMPWIMIVGVAVILGWSVAADSAIYSTGITEVSNPTQLGSAMALQAFVGVMSGFIGPIMFGGLLDLVNEEDRWAFGFSALGVLAVIGILALVRLRSLPQSCVMAKGKG